MRPKKCILLIDSDGNNGSVLSLVLRTHGYRVLEPASHKSIGQALVLAVSADLAILSHDPPHHDASKLAAKLRMVRRELPILFLAHKSGETSTEADLTINRVACSTAELLERVKILCVRKRGPRKGSQHAPKPEQPAAAVI